VAIDFGQQRRWSYVDVVLYLVGVAGLAASITLLFLGMRAVLDIGGFCAEGGPYQIQTHCPDGVALLMPLAVFGGFGAAGLMAWKGAALGSVYAGLVFLAWPALFLSLGWNFLEYAFSPPPGMSGIQLGWLIPGILFVIMGAVPLLSALPIGRALRRPAAGSATARAHTTAEQPWPEESNLRKARKRLLNDLVAHAQAEATSDARPAGAAMPAADSDLVSRLERLDALHRSGALTYDEFQRAKAALLAGEGG
jgi:hypothetical protein